MATRIVFVNGQETVVTETEDQVVQAVRRDHPDPVKLEGVDGIVTMAWDLAQEPRTALKAQLCGDAHLANFGTFAALGEEVHYNAVTPAAYSAFGFPGADELANMFQFNTEFVTEFGGARDVATSRRLNPGLTSYRQWLGANIEKIRIV